MNTALKAVGVGLVLFYASAAQALPIYVDQDATYRYINATPGTDVGAPASNWYENGFDDSGWFEGQAPFSSGATSGTFGVDLGNVNDPFDGTAPAIPGAYTQWDVPYDPYLRTTFTLTEATDLTVWLAVDNGINSMYINGVLATGTINAEGAAHRWEHVFDISSAYTFTGVNTIALQLEDHGGATAFMMLVTGDDAAENPEFTTNPPPESVPAPGALALFGLGLIGMGVRRRSR